MAKSTAKMVGLNGQIISLLSDDAQVYALSEKQISAILSLIHPMKWRTRWDNPISDIDAFSGETEFNLMNPLDICQLVADCIESGGDVYKLIVKYGGGGGYPTYPVGSGATMETITESANTPLFDYSGACDYNAVYGACWALVQWLNQSTMDFLEKLSADDNLWRNASNLISASPILGQTPADEMLEFTADLIENIAANYLAAVTELYLREISCDFFCIAIDTCSLDLSDVMGYFAGKCTVDTALTTWIDLIAVSAGFGTNNPLWFDYISYLQLAILAMRSQWLGYRSLDAVVMVVRAGLNDDDPDWSIYCDDCIEELLPITITFDIGGYENYSILQGSVQALGNGGNSLRDSRTCSHCSNKAEIDVMFDIAQAVDAISVDVYTLFNTITWSITAYDASNAVIWSDSGNPVTTPNAWTTLSYSSLALAGVKRIRISNGNGSGAVSTFLDNRIDNVYVA